MKVVVIIARGLHLGYLGCYGNEWIATPTLDRLAAEGIVFDQHFADCPNPAGARRAWRSGRYQVPPAPGEVTPQAEVSADLIEILRLRAIGTALVLDESRPGAANFASGWEDVTRVAAPDEEESWLEATLQAAVEALDRLAEFDEWLLWLDLATVLPPWNLPEPFGERYFAPDGTAVDEEPEEEVSESDEEPLRPLSDPVYGRLDAADHSTFLRLQRSYGGAVSFLDAGLELLLEELDNRHLMEEVLLLFTADHGFALGEHGIVGDCRPWLHEELVHLPLLVRFPAGAEGGRRIGTLTQAVDLMPTLLDGFGLPVPPTDGYSLLPMLNGQIDAVRAYACTGLQSGAAVEWSLRCPRWAFLLPLDPGGEDPPRGPQLFVKPDDRWEINNVFHHHGELAENLEQTLRSFVQATRQPGPLLAPELREMGELLASEPISKAGGDKS
jgi:hypothetical protein